MPTDDRDLVIRVLRDPPCVRDWPVARFDLLLRQARRSNLIARLAEIFDSHGLTAQLPGPFVRHLEGSQRLLRSHQAEIGREVEFIRRALQPLGIPVVLLKGAAYMLASLPASMGRLFNDVDILVPRQRLAEAEAALMLNGWVTTHASDYDQRYYREWMHELPPMVHAVRQTSLDVHHALVPLTARWRSPASPLLSDARDVPGVLGVKVLAPVDMVLHSMVHLLLNEELSHGLRDVSDLDLLLRDFGADAAFWPALVGRAEQLGLQRALHHGLWCARAVLGTPVPPATQSAVAPWGPGALAGAVLKAAWRRALRSPHPSAADAMTPLALFALYVRAHWLRMPPLMLCRHLTIKAWRQYFDTRAKAG